MRHGYRPKIRVSNPDALGFGFEFIQSLVIRWINYRYEIVIQKSGRDIGKICKTNIPDFKFMTHTESYYEYEESLKRGKR